MRNDRYAVYFVGQNTPIVIDAASERDAIILACAELIKDAKHCRVCLVQNIDQGTQREMDLRKESPLEINWMPEPYGP
jgi:hypothetical protein